MSDHTTPIPAFYRPSDGIEEKVSNLMKDFGFSYEGLREDTEELGGSRDVFRSDVFSFPGETFNITAYVSTAVLVEPESHIQSPLESHPKSQVRSHIELVIDQDGLAKSHTYSYLDTEEDMVSIHKILSHFMR